MANGMQVNYLIECAVDCFFSFRMRMQSWMQTWYLLFAACAAVCTDEQFKEWPEQLKVKNHKTIIFGSTVIRDLIGVEVVQFDQTIGGGSSCVCLSLHPLLLLSLSANYLSRPWIIFVIRFVSSSSSGRSVVSRSSIHCDSAGRLPGAGLVGKSSVTWK